MTATIEFTKADYTEAMQRGEAGEGITQEWFDLAKAFAKARKVKQPKAEWVVEAKPAKGTKAKNRVAKAPRVLQADLQCEGKDDGVRCDRTARSHGLCAKHFQQDYRQDPAKREAANEASRRYQAKRRAEKAKAAAEKAAAEAAKA